MSAEAARYIFSTVRVVPNPATGEFANLAAIVGSDETGEWAIRSLGNEKRARQFCGTDALLAAHDFVTRIGLSMDLLELTEVLDLDLEEEEPTEQLTEAWLSDLALTQRHVVQLSPPAPILAHSADAALDLVFTHVLHEPELRHRTLDKRRLLSAMTRSFADVGLEVGGHVLRRPRLEATGPHRFTHPIDFVVRDDAVRQIIQMWSFQVTSQADLDRDVKAWGWTLRETLSHGGSILSGKNSLHVPGDVAIDVVVAPPTDLSLSRRYDEALSVFAEFNASVHAHGDERDVAERSLELLGAIDE